MELDELKQKWTELSEQVEKNELLNRQIIIDMIQSKKETHLQQQLRVEKMAFGVLGIFLMVFAGNGDMAFAHADSYVSDYIYLKDSN